MTGENVFFPLKKKHLLITDTRKDPLGRAISDYLEGNTVATVTVFSDVSDPEPLPADYLFRSLAEMPKWEITALDQCKGRVLELGAGAGSHSLVLKERGFEVVSMDVSPGAVNVMKARGVDNPVHADLWQWEQGGFDTVLLLMNGLGLAGNIDGLRDFLYLAKTWLEPGGQLLADSSDLSYLIVEEAESAPMSMIEPFQMEVNYRMQYLDATSEPFTWLYLDFSTLEDVAYSCGYTCECLEEGENYQYLARLTPLLNTSQEENKPFSK